jgi:hypothetical protein
MNIKQVIHLRKPKHPTDCPKCDALDALDVEQTFYADRPSWEYFGNDGTMTYRPLGRYALIVWPKGWRKSRNYTELYPTFNIYPKLVAAFEFMDHSRYYEPGDDVQTKYRTK